jgi:protein-L-isoaspartate(D-aspartate) O-methyltransferase
MSFNMSTTSTHAASAFNKNEARFNMIEQQIRTWEVLDPKVLALFDIIKREDFVAESQKGLAFADVELPIGCGQTMLSPKLEGRILQALDVQSTDKVLVVGTGSGYLTALLASLADHVHAIEIHPELSELAQVRLKKQKIHNVTLHVADASNGYPKDAPYDLIVFTGALPLRPIVAEKMLRMGGRLFAVTGELPIMHAALTHRVSEEAFRHETLFETCLPYLDHAQQISQFEF